MRDYTVSKHKLKESAQYLAGGVSSTLRAAMKPTPLFAQSGKGTRIQDADGNEYIDYLLAYGPLILGHAHTGLTREIHRAMEKGYTYGLQHDGEIQLARTLTEILPCAEQVAFSGSGTEAVMLALRLSKAYTGKRKVVRFHGHYHGWSDMIFTSFPAPDMQHNDSHAGNHEVLPGTAGQSHASLEEVILLPWNDEAALEEALRSHGHEIAAVITEPVMCNSGCIAPKQGYLQHMRELTKELGIVLIFDEVITGFRLGLSGAHGRFGIQPDLMTMGKAMAGGIALSAVAGRKEIMNLIAEGKVNHLGTLNGNSVATAAAQAVIDQLSMDNGGVFTRMEDIARKLSNGLKGLMRKHGFAGVINRMGPVFHMMFINRQEVSTFNEFAERDAAIYSKFAEQMLHEGVLVRNNGLWYVSAVHTDEDVELTLSAADRALASI